MRKKKKENKTMKACLADIAYFTSKIELGNISSSMMEEYETMIKRSKEKYVLEAHRASDGTKKSIHERTKLDKSSGVQKTFWYTRINKQITITSKTYDDLIEKLFDYYVSEGKINPLEERLDKMFPDALRWWEETHGIDIKTTMEYQRVYRKYYEKHPIIKKNLPSTTLDDWYDFFEDICRDYKLTRKKFMQAKIVATILDTYAIRNRIIPYSRIAGVDLRSLPYTKEKAYVSIDANAFTDTQKEQIKNWCREDMKKTTVKAIYDFAILFNIEMGLRFSELVALTWEKVSFEEQTLLVDCQAPVDYERDKNDPNVYNSLGRVSKDHMKAYENPRVLYLTDDMVNLLMEIKEYCTKKIKKKRGGRKELYETDPIFFDEGFRYHTYNEKIKKAAAGIGLPRKDYRTHSLRATAATSLYRRCRDIKTVQYFLGHTTPEMTSKYIKQLEMVTTLKEAFAGH